eukprot:972036_1
MSVTDIYNMSVGAARTSELKSILNDVLHCSADDVRFAGWCEQQNEKTGKTANRLILVANFRVYSIKKVPVRGLKLKGSYKLMDVCFVNIMDLGTHIGADEMRYHIIMDMDAEHSNALSFHCDQETAHKFASTMCYCVDSLKIQFPRLRKTHFTLPNGFNVKIKSTDSTEGERICLAYQTACDYLDAAPLAKVSEYLQEFVMTYNHKRAAFDLGKVLAYLEGETIVVLDYKQINSIAFALQSSPLLRAIQLVDLNIRDAGLSALGNIFYVNNYLRQISIDNIGIGMKGVNKLAGWLSTRTAPLDVLSLRNCKLTDKGVAKLAVGLRELPLRVLTLGTCAFGRSGVRLLCDTLRLPTWCATLEHLDVSDNQLGRSGTGELIKWLKFATSLKSLVVYNTNMDLGALATALNKNESVQIETLDIGNNPLASKSVESLTEYLSTTTALKHLVMRNTNFRDLQFHHVLGALYKNSANKNGFVLNFSKCKLGTLATRAFNSLFLNPTIDNVCSIRQLDLSYNDLGAEGFKTVCRALGKCTALERLSLDCNIRAGKGASESACSALAILIERNKLPKLKYLSLRGNPQTRHTLKQSIQPIIASLQGNTSLTCLDISGNLMGNVGFLDLSFALGSDGNRCLKVVKCDKNKIDVSGFLVLCQAIKTNDTICEIFPEKDLKRILSVKVKKGVRTMTSVLEEASALLDINRKRGRMSEEMCMFDSDDPCSTEFKSSYESKFLSQPPQGLACRQPMMAPWFVRVDQQQYKNSTVRLDACCLPEQNDLIEFGVPLKDLAESQTVSLQHYPVPLPVALVRSFRTVALLGGIKEARVFALSANPEKMAEYKRALNIGRFYAASDRQALASLLRVWLQELPLRLLGELRSEDLILADSPEKVDSCLGNLEEPTRSVAAWFLDVFAFTAEHELFNELSAQTLARLFAPVLFSNLISSDVAVGFLTLAIQSRQDMTDDNGNKLQRVPTSKVAKISESLSNATTGLATLDENERNSLSHIGSIAELSTANDNMSDFSPRQSVESLENSEFDDSEISPILYAESIESSVEFEVPEISPKVSSHPVESLIEPKATENSSIASLAKSCASSIPRQPTIDAPQLPAKATDTSATSTNIEDYKSAKDAPVLSAQHAVSVKHITDTLEDDKSENSTPVLAAVTTLPVKSIRSLPTKPAVPVKPTRYSPMKPIVPIRTVALADHSVSEEMSLSDQYRHSSSLSESVLTVRTVSRLSPSISRLSDSVDSLDNDVSNSAHVSDRVIFPPPASEGRWSRKKSVIPNIVSVKDTVAMFEKPQRISFEEALAGETTVREKSVSLSSLLAGEPTASEYQSINHAHRQSSLASLSNLLVGEQQSAKHAQKSPSVSLSLLAGEEQSINHAEILSQSVPLSLLTGEEQSKNHAERQSPPVSLSSLLASEQQSAKHTQMLSPSASLSMFAINPSASVMSAKHAQLPSPSASLSMFTDEPMAKSVKHARVQSLSVSLEKGEDGPSLLKSREVTMSSIDRILFQDVTTSDDDDSDILRVSTLSEDAKKSRGSISDFRSSSLDSMWNSADSGSESDLSEQFRRHMNTRTHARSSERLSMSEDSAVIVSSARFPNKPLLVRPESSQTSPRSEWRRGSQSRVSPRSDRRRGSQPNNIGDSIGSSPFRSTGNSASQRQRTMSESHRHSLSETNKSSKQLPSAPADVSAEQEVESKKKKSKIKLFRRFRS